MMMLRAGLWPNQIQVQVSARSTATITRGVHFGVSTYDKKSVRNSDNETSFHGQTTETIYEPLSFNTSPRVTTVI
eukprot:4505344-Pleurochrysis_carterae.AAC.1